MDRRHRSDPSACRLSSLAGNTAGRPLRILVIGATSGVGLETVRLALARGHTVTGMSRRAPKEPIPNDRLHYVQGDITHATDVPAAAANQDVIVTAISIDPSRGPISVFSTGARDGGARQLSQRWMRSCSGLWRGKCASRYSIWSARTRRPFRKMYSA